MTNVISVITAHYSSNLDADDKFSQSQLPHTKESQLGNIPLQL
jgi:hypothetical protein